MQGGAPIATLIDIAEAVRGELAAGGFSLAFIPERHYTFQYDLLTMKDLRVTVVPRGQVSTLAERGRDAFDYLIDVTVQQRAAGLDQSDALTELVEEIADRFRRQVLPNYRAARCVAVANDPIYDEAKLDQQGLFDSTIIFTFRVWR